MKDNKYLMQFCKLPHEIYNMVEWEKCYKHQLEVKKWCEENIGTEESFPYWQFGGRTGRLCIPDVAGDYDAFVVSLYEGVFIMSEEARVAFTLRFPIINWT